MIQRRGNVQNGEKPSKSMTSFETIAVTSGHHNGDPVGETLRQKWRVMPLEIITATRYESSKRTLPVAGFALTGFDGIVQSPVAGD
jgi:hypothetical protein